MRDPRLLLVDDHPLFREGLALAVKVATPELLIDNVGSIAEAQAMIALHKEYRLVLLDLMLPDARGFSGLMCLQKMLGRVPIVIISASQSPDLIEAARAMGAVGYFPKTQSLDEMLTGLRAVLAGTTAFPDVAPSDKENSSVRHRLEGLSDAQLRVLYALAGGRLNKQVACDLGITEATVKAHLTAVFRKLGVNNRTQAMLAVQPLVESFGA